MKYEQKTKQELISEIKALLKKNKELEMLLSKGISSRDVCGNETILVVDDNKYMRKTIVKMLNRCGYHILDTDSPRKAVEIIKSLAETIPLVLLDVVMPEINGPEIAVEILKIQPDIRIIFMSGYAEDEIVHDEVFKIIQSQATFIKKPFNMEKINTVIRHQLKKNIKFKAG